MHVARGSLFHSLQQTLQSKIFVDQVIFTITMKILPFKNSQYSLTTKHCKTRKRNNGNIITFIDLEIKISDITHGIAFQQGSSATTVCVEGLHTLGKPCGRPRS